MSVITKNEGCVGHEERVAGQDYMGEVEVVSHQGHQGIQTQQEVKAD